MNDQDLDEFLFHLKKEDKMVDAYKYFNGKYSDSNEANKKRRAIVDALCADGYINKSISVHKLVEITRKGKDFEGYVQQKNNVQNLKLEESELSQLKKEYFKAVNENMDYEKSNRGQKEEINLLTVKFLKERRLKKIWAFIASILGVALGAAFREIIQIIFLHQ